MIERRRPKQEEKLALISEIAEGGKVVETCRKHCIDTAMYYKWKTSYETFGIDGLKPKGMRLPRTMRNPMKENARLKRMVAEKELAIELLQNVLKKEVPAIMEKYGAITSFSDVSRYTGIPRSSFYSRRREGKRRRKPSSFTIRNVEGVDEIVLNFTVENVIEGLLSQEFVCYGYKKITKHVKNFWYMINRKKVRRLMKENDLLNHSNGRERGRRVIDMKLNLTMPKGVWGIDIKYVWVHDESMNAFLLVLMNCFTREEIGHYVGYSCRKNNVKIVTKFPFHERGTENIKNLRIRSDDDSQSIAGTVEEYLSSVDISHEAINPVTHQEDGYNEAMNSITERELIRQVEFDSLEDAKNIINGYMMFYNSERIHSAIKYETPKEIH